ncbi:MAG: cytidylate kinase family protein [Candidatus Thermoplasmatota archaeon]|nr:cytidylate kinase family protein [Candidatus Thermoplasmatota archaeon]
MADYGNMKAITVGGPPGSGTSSVCASLRDRLGVEYVYAGRIFRDRAVELGLTLEEFSELCERDRSYDIALDARMLSRARQGDVLLEGRMIGPLCKRSSIPSFRIYLDAERSIRAERVMVRDGGNIQEVSRQMKEREESEAQRYMEYYGINPRETVYYDLVLNSTNLSVEEEVRMILDELKER